MDKKIIGLIAISVILYSANIWGLTIYVLDEAKNSGCAMEMYHRSDWVVPTFNNELRVDKPPLHYFFMKLSYAIFGVSPFSARLFSVLMGILTMVVVYRSVLRFVDKISAFLSALI
ncbi:MAG TPA: glycosyltransferase family 39 protein, partial [Cyclobacteriaceae bacterium]|nr:glycosyltransferase family 39 protein [Cyclobacteriaceae bacterium]